MTEAEQLQRIYDFVSYSVNEHPYLKYNISVNNDDDKESIEFEFALTNKFNANHQHAIFRCAYDGDVEALKGESFEPIDESEFWEFMFLDSFCSHE